MKKFIAAALVCAMMVLGCIGAKAQTVTKSNEFSDFSSIEASYNFDVVIKEGTSKVEWIVDQVVEDLVQIYQKGNTLVLSFDTKSMTKEQKKHYKGKNAPTMVLKAIIHTPNLESLSLKDNVKVDASGAHFNVNGFTLKMEDETSISGLNVTARNVSVETLDKVSATASFDAPKVLLKSAKKSLLKANLSNCEELTVKTDGSAEVTASGSSEIINVNASGSSKIAITNGTAKKLGLASKNSAETDVTAYTLEEAELAMVGGKAYVNATKILSLDLKGGSLVSFMSDPSVEIVKVEKSSITRYNGKK